MTGDGNLATGGAIEARHSVYSRAFSGSAISLQNYQLPGCDIQVDIFDADYFRIAQRVDAGQTLCEDHGKFAMLYFFRLRTFRAAAAI